MIKKFLLTILLILTLCSGAVLSSVENLKFDGFIADGVGLLKPESVKVVNRSLKKIQKKTGATVAIVILKNTDGKEIESIGEKILEDYNIGNSQIGDGILFLISDKEKLFHVVLGKNYNNRITSEEAGELIKTEVVPYFQVEEYEKGLIHGANILTGSLLKENPTNNIGNWLWLLLFPIIVIVGAVGWYLGFKKSKS